MGLHIGRVGGDIGWVGGVYFFFGWYCLLLIMRRGRRLGAGEVLGSREFEALGPG
jgi:hypothetical protein